MEVYLAQPRGFCAGVVRAIEIVERALEKYGPPVYVRHEIVHNKYVVESLKNKGAIFVEDLSEVPPRAVTVFSAHGVARRVEEEAAARGLPVLNATCPLVTKVHNQGKRYVSKGRQQFQVKSFARKRHRGRCSELSRCRRQRAQGGMAEGCQGCRHHGRGFRAGGPGRRRDRGAAAHRTGDGVGAAGPRGEYRIP